MIVRDLIHFQNDFIISWDANDEGNPIITVSEIHAEGTELVLEVLGRAHERSGVISLRQVCEDYCAQKRQEEEARDNASK